MSRLLFLQKRSLVNLARSGSSSSLIPKWKWNNGLQKRPIISYIQQGLVDIQMLTGLPWWATIGSTAIILRMSQLPKLRYQSLAFLKFAKALPELHTLRVSWWKTLSFKSDNTILEKCEATHLFYQGAKAALLLHDASFFSVLAYPLSNLLIFVTFTYSVRGLLQTDSTGVFESGGLSWFRDLTSYDDTMILPFVAVSLTYLSLDLAFRASQNYSVAIKDVIQCLTILSIPMIVTLPTGVFCYWIPSSLFGLAQTFLLKKPAFQKLLRLPPPPPMALVKRQLTIPAEKKS